MQLETFFYNLDTGWSVGTFPDLDSEKTWVLFFASPIFYNQNNAMQELTAAYPKSIVVGCSSAGEIFNTQINDNSLTVAVIKFEHSRIAIASTVLKSSEDSRQAGESLSKSLLTSDLKSVFILSDGLNINGSELVKGLNSFVPLNQDIAITGGLAGDGDRFQQTWIWHNGQVKSHHVVGIGFYGSHVNIGHGSKGGWDSFGPERRITRAIGNVLYELDEQPALALYKQYLGERASGLPATALLFPLMIRENTQDETFLVRTILKVDEETQSLTFAGDVPEGHLAKLMRANFDRLVTGATEAAVFASKNMNAKEGAMLSIAISCVGRRLLLGERTEEETEATMYVLPKGCKQIGFYSYGEISPYGAHGRCDLHNQTMTLTTISENDAPA